MVIDEIIKRRYGDFNSLINMIKKRFPCLKINEENTETLLIEDMSLEQFQRTGFVGIYEDNKNRIGIFTNKRNDGSKVFDVEITEEELINTLVHELIHASTTRKGEDGLVYQGINIRQGKEDSILVALNEGITQMITDDVLNEESDAYPFLKCFAKQLGCIIGKEKLYEYYSTNNINGLVNEINSIYGEDIATELIYEIYLFSKVESGLINDNGSFLGDTIQSQLIELYKRSGSKDESFHNLVIDNQKAKKFAGLLPNKFNSIEDLGFKTKTFSEVEGKGNAR